MSEVGGWKTIKTNKHHLWRRIWKEIWDLMQGTTPDLTLYPIKHILDDDEIHPLTSFAPNLGAAQPDLRTFPARTIACLAPVTPETRVESQFTHRS